MSTIFFLRTIIDQKRCIASAKIRASRLDQRRPKGGLLKSSYDLNPDLSRLFPKKNPRNRLKPNSKKKKDKIFPTDITKDYLFQSSFKIINPNFQKVLYGQQQDFTFHNLHSIKDKKSIEIDVGKENNFYL